MQNPFSQAQFLLSCAQLTQLPDDEHPEVAFAGRSNSGKSSALNALCGRHSLARVSKTPGRTQLINLFGINDGSRLADLPGYGYASVPNPVRASWGRLIGGYVEKRRNLRGLFLIMDCRHPLTDYDKQMLAWTVSAGRDCHVLLTKADKLGYGASKATLLATRKGLKELGSQATIQLFSSSSHQGLDEARERLQSMLDGVVPGASAVEAPVA
ncbi:MULTISPECIES: ribosome biogenesis GTP-binding protein YihA/YsxC [Hydrocarboniphaga]|uniref:ribosome biogenesis GTP-binding protein YihA/YsxC n=1 Tax=Hydrocarboniphaga TaxID=243627 RepID=UPI000315A753|nr:MULTISPECIES: ribosome biogenesis GTP-binding protein YihA/YsxC [Hydrocarboniphaga]MDZ4080318.1 ribosome biogenesis GTP-binding protein YihA/YsxC [Hydrocarboniphaga sp.]